MPSARVAVLAASALSAAEFVVQVVGVDKAGSRGNIQEEVTSNVIGVSSSNNEENGESMRRAFAVDAAGNVEDVGEDHILKEPANSMAEMKVDGSRAAADTAAGKGNPAVGANKGKTCCIWPDSSIGGGEVARLALFKRQVTVDSKTYEIPTECSIEQDESCVQGTNNMKLKEQVCNSRLSGQKREYSCKWLAQQSTTSRVSAEGNVYSLNANSI